MGHKKQRAVMTAAHAAYTAAVNEGQANGMPLWSACLKQAWSEAKACVVEVAPVVASFSWQARVEIDAANLRRLEAIRSGQPQKQPVYKAVEVESKAVAIDAAVSGHRHRLTSSWSQRGIESVRSAFKASHKLRELRGITLDGEKYRGFAEKTRNQDQQTLDVSGDMQRADFKGFHGKF